MAPIPRHILIPLRARSSDALSTSDTNEPTDITSSQDSPSPPSPPSSTPMISLIITTIILSILVAGACYYLTKVFWKRYILPKRDKRRSRRLLAEKEKAWEGMAVYFGDSAGLGEQIGSDAGDQKGDRQKESGSPPVYTETAASKSPTKAKKGRTYSDELWSTTLDHETSSSSDDESDPLHNGTPGRDRPSVASPSQQRHQYGIARGSGYGPIPLSSPKPSPPPPPPPTPPVPSQPSRRPRRRQATSLSSVASISTTSSSILYASLGSPVVADTARAAKGETQTVNVRRGRFLSLGAGGVKGARSPLSMHPVREDDLVDVPLCGGGGTRGGVVARGDGEDKENGKENGTEKGLGIATETGKGNWSVRESWPLRSFVPN